MTDNGSSFSVATTAFVSLAICAIISYGVFYYFKQRLAVIEQSQMEQARILQAIISRGLAQHAHGQQQVQHAQPSQEGLAQKQVQHAKEITITQNGLIEVSSDDSGSSDSDSDSQSSDSDESESQDKWSIGDEIHQPDGYFKEFTETFKKNVLIDAICIDSSYVVDSVTISVANTEDTDDNACDLQQKKIISLNKSALGDDEDDDADDDDEDDSSSSEDQQLDNDNDNDNGNGKGKGEGDVQEFELKIGYKPNASAKAIQLNYGNMSVSALRQLAKERGVVGEEADLQKLKKKDLVQVLTSSKPI
jgi:hypothetical protein